MFNVIRSQDLLLCAAAVVWCTHLKMFQLTFSAVKSDLWNFLQQNCSAVTNEFVQTFRFNANLWKKKQSSLIEHLSTVGQSSVNNFFANVFLGQNIEVTYNIVQYTKLLYIYFSHFLILNIPGNHDSFDISMDG